MWPGVPTGMKRTGDDDDDHHGNDNEMTMTAMMAVTVKVTGYWPSSFFACLWTKTLQGHTMQKRMRLVSSHFNHTSLVNKGFT